MPSNSSQQAPAATPPPQQQQECQTGSICNQDSSVNAPQTVNNNFSPVARSLSDEQRKKFIAALLGKTVKLRFAYLINVQDGPQFASDLCLAAQKAIPTTDYSIIQPMMEGGNSRAWYGVEFCFKGDHPADGQMVTMDFDSPAGIVTQAFLAAGFNRGLAHLDSNMQDGEVLVLVGLPPP